MRLFSTEAVSKYHPDKYADQISDAILTECLKQDRQSHCGIETMVKGNTVVLGGEITSKADINYDQIVRRVAKKLGYRADKIINLISEQSPEINRAVLSDEDIGAGDQGIMFGYATRETASRLPYAFDVANRIIAALEDDADNNPDTILNGDAKRRSPLTLTPERSSRWWSVSATRKDATLMKFSTMSLGSSAMNVSVTIGSSTCGNMDGRRCGSRLRTDRSKDRLRPVRRILPCRRRRVFGKGPEQGRPFGVVYGTQDCM